MQLPETAGSHSLASHALPEAAQALKVSHKTFAKLAKVERANVKTAEAKTASILAAAASGSGSGSASGSGSGSGKACTHPTANGCQFVGSGRAPIFDCQMRIRSLLQKLFCGSRFSFASISHGQYHVAGDREDGQIRGSNFGHAEAHFGAHKHQACNLEEAQVCAGRVSVSFGCFSFYFFLARLHQHCGFRIRHADALWQAVQPNFGVLHEAARETAASGSGQVTCVGADMRRCGRMSAGRQARSRDGSLFPT